jgi:hypothetical protein
VNARSGAERERQGRSESLSADYGERDRFLGLAGDGPSLTLKVKARAWLDVASSSPAIHHLACHHAQWLRCSLRAKLGRYLEMRVGGCQCAREETGRRDVHEKSRFRQVPTQLCDAAARISVSRDRKCRRCWPRSLAQTTSTQSGGNGMKCEALFNRLGLARRDVHRLIRASRSYTLRAGVTGFPRSEGCDSHPPLRHCLSLWGRSPLFASRGD